MYFDVFWCITCKKKSRWGVGIPFSRSWIWADAVKIWCSDSVMLSCCIICQMYFRKCKAGARRGAMRVDAFNLEHHNIVTIITLLIISIMIIVIIFTIHGVTFNLKQYISAYSIIWTRNQGRADLSASSKEKPCRKKHTMFENWLFWTKEFFVDLWLGLGVMGWYGRLWDQSILVHWHPYWNEIKENSLCVTDFTFIVYKIISTSKP